MGTTDETMRPSLVAIAAEERGFEALLFPDHTHIPVVMDSRYPSGGNLPRAFLRLNDPFVSITAAASVTTRLKVGTCACLVVERDPIVTAKMVATVDHL